MSDIFSDTMTGLWNLILADSEMASLVKPGNRVRYDSATDRSPLKPQVQTADLPEMIIRPTSGVSTLGATSTSHRVVKNWGIDVVTGDQRYPAFLSPIQYRLMIAFGDTLDSLPDVSAVKKLRLLTDQEILSTGAAQGAARGWSMVAAVMTEIWLPKSAAARP